MTLNSTPIGGAKRHNYYRDDIWNIKYLPRFKWNQLKEAAIYNRHVRKARLDQKVSQARRENDFYLERVEQAKTRRKIAEKRAAKAGGDDGVEADGDGPGALPRRAANARLSNGADDADVFCISDRVLESLIF